MFGGLQGKPTFPLSEHQARNYLPSLRIPISFLHLSCHCPRLHGHRLKNLLGVGQATFEKGRMQGGLP